MREPLEIAAKIIAAVEQGKSLRLASDDVDWNVERIDVNKDCVRVCVYGDWSGGTHANQLATFDIRHLEELVVVETINFVNHTINFNVELEEKRRQKMYEAYNSIGPANL